MNWISVEDRLPSSLETVLLYNADLILVGWCVRTPDNVAWHAYGPNIKLTCQNTKVKNVTHWMPLPKPPTW